MSNTLFERIGGQNAVNAAVDIFYRKMLTDDRVCHFFDDIDMEKQIIKQKGFFGSCGRTPKSVSSEGINQCRHCYF